MKTLHIKPVKTPFLTFPLIQSFLESMVSKIENRIEIQEAELTQLNKSMQQAAQDKNGKRIAELSQAIHACQSAINQLFGELEKLTDEFDSQNAVFEMQLKQLESDLEENRC